MAELRVYLCALSNPVRNRSHYEDMISDFEKAGITLELSDLLEKDVSALEKAVDFNKALRSGRYGWIADVSGGDLANLVLPYLDYEAYASGNTYYAAFSDGTCIVNALAVRSQKKALLFPLWNQTDLDQAISIFKGGRISLDLTPLKDSAPWPRHGRLSGGNLRCFLKLAGTCYMPAVSGSGLVLESMSADWNAFRSMTEHLMQCGALDGIQAVILGRFNRLEQQLGGRMAALEKIYAFLSPLCGEDIGWYSDETLGHISDSSAVWISPQPSYEALMLEEVCRDLVPQSEEAQPSLPALSSQPASESSVSSHAPGPLPSRGVEELSSEQKPSELPAPAQQEPQPAEPVQEEEREEEEVSLLYDDDSLFDFDPDMTAELLVRQWNTEDSEKSKGDQK